MPAPSRAPMPKLPPFALAEERPPQPKRPYYLLIFFVLFTAPLVMLHAGLLSLPYFWDEMGQFIPTALDLLRHGQWVAHSTIPNVHPPGVEVYLVLWYKLFGYSIVITRIAMLLFAGTGLLVTFLLAIELSQGVRGMPAFWPPLFLIVSPLFFMQSMMAQLDMPAMVLTLLALLLFVQRRFAWAAFVCVLLVLVKETGLVTPLVFFALLSARRDWQRAAYFTAPAFALGIWLLVLHRATGYWLGNPGFAHYNVGYSLQPLRMLLTFTRRFYYLFVAELRFVGTAILLLTLRSLRPIFAKESWRTVLLVAAANIVLVSVFGGAELERYLLPVLPLFYIAVAIAITRVRKPFAISTIALLTLGLAANLFWNPIYPFPYENNLAMVDFVRLQQSAAEFAERNLSGSRIATAWPYTAALRSPDYGFVTRHLRTLETTDFHYRSIAAIARDKFDVLIVYTREWDSPRGMLAFPVVRRTLARLYDWQPPISDAQCEQLGLYPYMSWGLHGQNITIFTRLRSGATSTQASRLPQP